MRSVAGAAGSGTVAFALATEPLPDGLAEVGAPGVVAGRCSAAGLAPDDVVGGVDGAVVVEVAGQTRHGGERHFAGGVEIGEVPGVGAGNGERAGGRHAGPIEQVDRPAALGGDVDAGREGQFQRAAERHGNARREGDRRIPRIGVEHQPQRAGGVHRQVLVHDDRQRAGRRSRGRIAVVVADDQRRAGRQVEARNVPVGLNQIAGIRAGQRGVVESSLLARRPRSGSRR